MEVKARNFSKYKKFDGQAYLAVGEDVDYTGENHVRNLPCSGGESSGVPGQWVELPDFFLMLEHAKCPHEHVCGTGGFHFLAGEVWDDISAAGFWTRGREGGNSLKVKRTISLINSVYITFLNV